MNKFKKFLTIAIVILLAFAIVACDNENGPPINGPGNGPTPTGTILENITLPTDVLDNIALPGTVEGFPYRVTWASDTQHVIGNSGIVSRQHYDVVVTLRARSSTSAGVIFRDFPVTVVGFGAGRVNIPNAQFQTATGFVALGMNTTHNNLRASSERRVDGVWTTIDEDPSVRIVNDEVEFLRAFGNPAVQIIEITNDLNMGFDFAVGTIESPGLLRLALNEGELDQAEFDRITQASVFRRNDNIPQEHPRLIRYGVSQLRVTDRHGLIIFSRTGITISHMTTRITDSSDIVFRNLHLTGIWEWDDADGSYDANDWDHFTIERTNGIWLDHLTLDQAYDGIVDTRHFVTNLTLSYVKMNFVVNDFIQEQMDHLYEMLIANPEPPRNAQVSRFMRLIEGGAAFDDIVVYAATQMKGFNFGNTAGGLDFETFTVTMHHMYVRNLRDRLPRIRQGDAHLFNIYYNQTELSRIRAIITQAGGRGVTSQGIVTTEQGTVMMQNSMFVNVAQPIRNHQDANLDPRFTGSFRVENSIFRDGMRTVLAGCQDDFTPWRRANTNIYWDREFFYTNHQTIPYLYQHLLVDPTEVRNTLISNGIGAGARVDFPWLRIDFEGAIDRTVSTDDYHRIDADALVMPPVLFDINAPRGTNPNLPWTSGFHGETGAPMVFPFTQRVRNFYRLNFALPYLAEGFDFTITVDTSAVDWTRPGRYVVIYTFRSLVNDWDVVELIQDVVIFDGEAANEIFALSVTDEYDRMIDFTANVFVPSGEMYYLVSNNAIEDFATVRARGTFVPLDMVQKTVSGVLVDGLQFLHIITISDIGVESEVLTTRLVNERIVYVEDEEGFIRMIGDTFGTRNTKFILTRDLDFTGIAFPQWDASHRFHGVFDGGGHTIANIGTADNPQLRSRGGIFSTIDGGTIRNFIVDNVHFEVDSFDYFPDPENYPEVFIHMRSLDDHGIVSAQVHNFARLENIVVKNSSIDSYSNYTAAFIGRIRTGIAYMNNLSVINTSIIQRSDSRFLGGFLGANEARTIVTMTNLYASGMHLEHEVSDMIGVVLGRARATAIIENVVLDDVTVTGRHNIGIISGKEELTVEFTTVRNIFADVTLTLQPQLGGAFSNMFGYIFGNSDRASQGANSILTENMLAYDMITHAAAQAGRNSNGWNVDVQIVDRALVLTPEFFLQYIPELMASDLWTFVDGLPRLINSITD